MQEVCMNNSLKDMDIFFEGVYQKLNSPDFGKNLGGELPLFIQQIPVSKQSELKYQANRLVSRLGKNNKKAIIIDLFDLSIDILNEEGVLQTLLEEEKELDPDAISSTLDSILDIKDVVIPRINDIIQEESPDFTFMTGVGRVYPFLRSHGILNNIEELANESYLILFFPGDYNNLQLSLFGIISDENYYRGHNLNDIKCSYDNI
jgi:hypothetical protein